MAPSTENDRTTDWVTEIYVAVFPVSIAGEPAMAETILAGYRKDQGGKIRVRATVETRRTAVPDMVAMCDRIVADQEPLESYRLLKFDKTGVHELDPDDFRGNDSLFFSRYPRETWGVC